MENPGALGVRRREDDEEEDNNIPQKKRVVSSEYTRTLEEKINHVQNLHSFRVGRMKQQGEKLKSVVDTLKVRAQSIKLCAETS